MATKPYEITASVMVKASQKQVFEYMRDLKNFDDWNPFAAMAKNMTMQLSEVTDQVGATYTYSDKRMGSGEMTILTLHPDTLIRLQMKFMMPNEEIADIRWSLSSTDGETRVTWAMNGERDAKARFMNAIFQFDKMMVKNFTDGLAALKAKLEA